MADVRFEHDSGGYIALMQSGAMRSVLHEYSDRIEASAAGSIGSDKGTPLERPPYASYDFTTSERAGVRVQTNNPHADYAERKYGILQGAAGV